MENRNGQCRYSIVIKNIYGNQERNLKAYMFVRKDNRNIEILIGDLSIKNNQGELSGITSVSGLSGTEYSLEDVSGIVIAEDEEVVYGTCWDDEPLDIGRFFVREEPAEVEAAQATEVLQEEELEILDLAALLPKEEPEDDAVAEREVEEPDPTENEEPAQESEPFKRQEEGTQQEVFMEPEDALEPDPDLKDFLDQEETAASQVDTTETKRTSESDVFEMIGRALSMCPRMFPFDDDEMVSCVRFEPQDIGRLPIKFWMYGSNSFLLHGYYAYRHLILAEMKEEEEETTKYILGVPGLNHSREAFMANMFGFRLFKPVCASTAGVCDFGYWYVILE